MSISVAHNPELYVNPKNLQRLLHDPQLIAQLARQLVAGQVEAHIEMGRDMTREYPTHADAAAMIKGARETVEEYFGDLVTDFRDAVYDEFRKVEIDVKLTTFSAEGFEDAEVVVK